MTTHTRRAPRHDVHPLPLSLEAERLALQIEQALHDPAATKDVFFKALERYSMVLTSLAQQRSTPVLVKH